LTLDQDQNRYRPDLDLPAGLAGLAILQDEHRRREHVGLYLALRKPRAISRSIRRRRNTPVVKDLIPSGRTSTQYASIMPWLETKTNALRKSGSSRSRTVKS
jgi:hypothetical protein